MFEMADWMKREGAKLNLTCGSTLSALGVQNGDLNQMTIEFTAQDNCVPPLPSRGEEICGVKCIVILNNMAFYTLLVRLYIIVIK